MLVYAVEFPAKTRSTIQDVTQLAKQWLTGGPHYPWEGSDLTHEPTEKIAKVNKYDQEVTWGTFPTEPEPLTAFRHIWSDKFQFEWTTEIIAKQIDGVVWVSTRLHCSSAIAGASIPDPRKPFLVNLLLTELGGGNDGGFNVSDIPISLTAADLESARAIIRGELENDLPIVYVSVLDDGSCYVDCKVLARKMGGLAHVVVEPDRKFSFDLRTHVNGRNAYGGAIGIYWPHGATGYLRFLPDQMSSPEMEEIVCDSVRQAACAIRSRLGLTWSAIDALVSRKHADELRASGEQNINQYIETFGSEVAAKESLLQEANVEIERLRAEVRKLASENQEVEGLIKPGNESDLFSGEIREILVSVFTEALSRSHDDSRTTHVLRDLITANPAGEKRSAYKDVVKRTLSTTRKLSAGEIKALEDIGFKISEDGKHYKAVFCGDDRYTFAISKTSSDVRAGKNLVSQINRMLFA
jgi:hypothetical protein